MRYLILVIPLLAFIFLATQPAKADDWTISVLDNTSYNRNFPDQAATRNYQFSLNTNFFNVTDNLTDDNAIWESIIRAQIIENGDISTSNSYTIAFQYNDTWELVYTTNYIKESFGHWEMNWNFALYNGSLSTTPEYSCSSSEFLGAFLGSKTAPPNPWIVFQYNLNGRASTSPSLYISFGDDRRGDQTCNLPTSIGGGIQIPMGELFSVPSVEITTYDSELYEDTFTYEFDTRQHELVEQERFNEDNAADCQATFIFFGPCDIAKLFSTVLSWTFGLIASVLNLVLDIIPLGDEIRQIMEVPITIISEYFTLLTTVFFYTSAEHGIGGVWWAHVIWFTTFGLLITALTGQIKYSYILPWLFIVGSGKALFYTARFMFVTLPMLVWDKILAVFNAIRG